MLTILADPKTSGDHEAMVASILDQLNSLCIRPGTLFDLPSAAQVLALLSEEDTEAGSDDDES